MTIDTSVYWIPIEGLTVMGTWSIGAVTIRPADRALADLPEPRNAVMVDRFAGSLRDLKAGTLAGVAAAGVDEAIDLASQAIDLLRVFQHVRHFTTHLTQFGLPGAVSRGVIPYAQVTADGSGFGFRRRGEALGWTFSDSDEWSQAETFVAVGSAIGKTDAGEGHRRALVGAQLLSEALVEQRGAFRMVALVSALEAWLLPRSGSGQTFRLARAVAYFGCGRHDNNLCGRNRDTCPYLELKPGESRDSKQLKRLRTKGAEPPWRCSEWHRVVDWYDLRSDVVHGAGPDISFRDASNALYWTARYLTEPILRWLVDHPEDPVGDLNEALLALPPSPDWEERLGPL